MLRLSMSRNAIGAIALSVVCIVGATSASAACRGPVRGTLVTGINQTLTEVRARASWRNRVNTMLGYRFARWGYARNKNMECDKPRPGRRWACRAVASPCDRAPRSS